MVAIGGKVRVALSLNQIQSVLNYIKTLITRALVAYTVVILINKTRASIQAVNIVHFDGRKTRYRRKDYKNIVRNQ